MNEEMNPDDFYEYWEGMVKTSTLVTTEDYDNYSLRAPYGFLQKPLQK